MENKFDIYQKVKIIGPTTCEGDLHKGEEFEITYIRSNFERKLEYSGTNLPWYPAGSLRLVEELNVGDWVEAIGPASYFTQYAGKPAFRITKGPNECGGILGLGGVSNCGDCYGGDGTPFYSPASLRKLAPDEIAKYMIEKRIIAIEEHLKQIDERIEKSPIGCHENLHKQIEAQFVTLKEQQLEPCHRNPKRNCALKNVVNRMDCAVCEEISQKILDNIGRNINGRGLEFTR